MVDRSDYNLRAVQQRFGERKIKPLTAMKEIRIQKRNLYFFNENKNSYQQILNFFPLLAKNCFDLISFVLSSSVVTWRCPCSLKQMYILYQNKITRNYKTTIQNRLHSVISSTTPYTLFSSRLAKNCPYCRSQLFMGQEKSVHNMH